MKGKGQRDGRGRVHTEKTRSEGQGGSVHAALVLSSICIHILFRLLAVRRSSFLRPPVHWPLPLEPQARASCYCGLTALTRLPRTHTATGISAKLICSTGRAAAAGPSDHHLLSLPFCKAAYRSVLLSHTYVFLLAMLPPEYTLFFKNKKRKAI